MVSESKIASKASVGCIVACMLATQENARKMQRARRNGGNAMISVYSQIEEHKDPDPELARDPSDPKKSRVVRLDLVGFNC